MVRKKGLNPEILNFSFYDENYNLNNDNKRENIKDEFNLDI
ncbi:MULTISPECIES: hypothetical protein [Helcococcus]|uniref:Uncharacterized protein n=1 Tax=Helcococcus bovis TaxID=3153252 RepID=A0ABW9F5S7_9FIRM